MRLLCQFVEEMEENCDYKSVRAEWEKIYGDKVADSMSIRDRIRQKSKS